MNLFPLTLIRDILSQIFFLTPFENMEDIIQIFLS